MATLAELMYYPNEKYVSRGWAPEKIPLASLRELAGAQAAAVKAGILSPALAQKFLANVLVEGRHGSDKVGGKIGMPDFGFNDMGYAPTPDMDRKMQQMGLTVGQRMDEPPEESKNWGDAEWDEYDRKASAAGPEILRIPGKGYTPNYGDDYSEGYLGTEAERVHARLAALMLAHKAKLYGEDKAIERWNGIGPGARNHAAKVETMMRMLSRPENKPLMDAYTQFLGGDAGAPTGATLRDLMR